MADYTVRVVGENSGGSNSVSPQTPSNSPEPPVTSGTQPQARDYMPDTNRLTEEYRKLLQQQGGVVIPGSANSRQIWSQVEANAKQDISARISNKYDGRRSALDEKYEEKFLSANDRYKDEQQRILSKYKGRDSKFIENTDEWKENERWFEQYGRQLDKDKAVEDKQINREEKDELAAALRELTATLKDSKEAAEREDERGDNPNSYLGRLRAERRQILEERENAPTKEAAEAAGKRLADVDERIKRASSPSDTDYLRSTQLVAGGFQQTIGGIQQADPGSIINGVGSSIVGMTGATGAGAMKALGWIGLAAAGVKGIWDVAQGSAERYNAMGDLAAMRGTYYGMSGENASAGVRAQIEDGSYAGIKVSDFGMSYTDFASRAKQMIRSRGTSDNWFNENMRQIGLEKELALDSGALLRGSQYDRYGINVTDAISQMVSVLEKIESSGVSETDFTRVQEKYDIQQQMMGSYMNRSDRPDYAVANQQLAAMSSVQDITQDARVGTDYQQFQNAIQNPMNDRMKALLYSTVQEMMPEMKGTDGNYYTALDAGRMDLIDRAIRNPENEGKIMQAMIQKISEMYGGIDTQMGYFAFKNLFPNIAPDRLDAYVKQMSDPNSDVAKILKSPVETGTKSVREITLAQEKSYAWTQQSTQYVADLTKDVAAIKNNMASFIDKIDNWLNGRGYLYGAPVNGRTGN